MNFSNKLYLWVSLIPFFLATLLILVISLFFKYLPPKLPLFYSLSWGEKILVPHQQFLLIPLSLLLIALINLALSHQLHSSQIFFKKILLINSLVISLILTITFIRIILIFI